MTIRHLLFASLFIATAACGGSKPVPVAPEPVAAAPEPAPEPAPAPEPEPEPAPPPPTYPGWYASADAVVVLAEDGTGTLETRGKKASKPQKLTYDKDANTLTVAKKASPIRLEPTGELVATIGGKEHTLARQPDKLEGTNFANDNGSVQLNADNTCIHGVAGIPAKCTYTLEGGKLNIKYDEKGKKAVSWPVWWEAGGKVLHTPKETFTSTT